MYMDINLVSTDNKREMHKRKVWSSKPQQPVSISVKSLFDIYLILKDTLLHRLDQLSPQPLQMILREKTNKINKNNHNSNLRLLFTNT